MSLKPKILDITSNSVRRNGRSPRFPFACDKYPSSCRIVAEPAAHHQKVGTKALRLCGVAALDIGTL